MDGQTDGTTFSLVAKIPKFDPLLTNLVFIITGCEKKILTKQKQNTVMLPL